MPIAKDKLATLISHIKESTVMSKGLLVPISGGSDSALAFWLLCQACPEKTLGVFCGQDLRCRSWFLSHGPVEFMRQPEFLLDKETARLALFHDYCLKHNFWLVGTRNRTEDVFGTYSMASRLATFFPIVGLWKSDIMRLCSHVGVPGEITASSRRADPDCGRPIEMAEIPLETIDAFLKFKLGLRTNRGISKSQQDYLDRIYRYNRFKSQLPIRGLIV